MTIKRPYLCQLPRRCMSTVLLVADRDGLD